MPEDNSKTIVVMVIIAVIVLVIITFVLGYRTGFVDGVSYIKPYMSVSLPIPTPI